MTELLHESDRRGLWKALAAMMGEEPADTLMTLLTARPRGTYAMTADISELRNDLRADVAELRNELRLLRATLHALALTSDGSAGEG